MANSNALLILHVPLKMEGSFTLHHMCSFEVFVLPSCRATLNSALVPKYQQINTSRVNTRFPNSIAFA
jgi:hypothetical protein